MNKKQNLSATKENGAMAALPVEAKADVPMEENGAMADLPMAPKNNNIDYVDIAESWEAKYYEAEADFTEMENKATKQARTIKRANKKIKSLQGQIEALQAQNKQLEKAYYANMEIQISSRKRGAK